MRDLRFDFFRGLALIFIFIDHISYNFFTYLTSRSCGFSDAAEIFVFISGYSAALVYVEIARRKGVVFGGAQVLRRTWQLYVAHMSMFIIFAAQVAWTSAKFNNPMYVEELGIVSFLDEPHIAVAQAMLLKFKPTNLDILPLYVVLLGSFPLAMAILRRDWRPLFAASLALYFAARLFEFFLPAYPEGSEWTFNPLCWQFLFVIGPILGARREARPLVPRSRVMFRLAVAYLAFSFAVSLSWVIPGLSGDVPHRLVNALYPMGKEDLSPWRLLHVLALIYAAVYLLRKDHTMFSSRLARPIVVIGQASLQVFCLGIFLWFVGSVLYVEIGHWIWFQAIVNVGGVALMLAAAVVVSWYKRCDLAGASKSARALRLGEAVAE